MDLHGLLRGYLYFLCYVRTSEETHLCVSAAFYGDSFTFSYVDYVRTSQETHLCASTACYADSFTFLMYIMFVPHRKHTYDPP
jgi:hypothetical protein